MEILVVDDEPLILEGEVELIQKCAPESSVKGIRHSEEALEYVRTLPVDVVFLDIEMPVSNGIILAKQMKVLQPKLNIIFATAYHDYYESALSLRASGYLLKPLNESKVLEELENLRFPVRTDNGLFVRTFGSFELFFHGKPMELRYKKTKELFAYLIDRRGAYVSLDELETVLWGGEATHTSYLRQLIKDLTDSMEQIGCGDLLLKRRGLLGLWADRIHCDYYDWIHDLPSGINAYRGEYMRQYAWGEETRVNLEGGAGLWDD